MSADTETFSLIGQQVRLDASQREHAASVWFGDDSLITQTRAAAHQQLDAVLDAQEAQIIGMKAKKP